MAAHAATDFSDYSVFASASSTTVSTIKIGATTDSETAITANTTATGDDVTGTDDEDGVTLPSSVALGASSSMTVNVTNTSGASVYLNVWIDFNRNGVLTDSGEQVASNTIIATGTSGSNKTVNFTVPATATVGTAGVRVRLTSTSTPGSTGLIGNGEVEDNVMTLACPTVTFSPTTLTTPTVGGSYSQTLTASGSSTTFSYAVTSGSLPAGLSLSTAGVLSGTPTSTNSTTFTVTATGANSCAGSQSYTVTPVCPTLSFSPSAAGIPDSYVSSAFSQTITASGGTTPYTYAVTSGTLPAGLSLSSAGVISGTPTTSNGSGTSVTITATDARNCQGSLTYTVQVCPVISMSPATLPAPGLGSPYNQTVSASGGAGVYSYSIATGSLPSGMTLNSSTGVISGTPTSTAAATFTVNAADANGCLGIRSYSFTPASTDFGDYSSFGSVSSTYNSNLKLGAIFDAESSATTNATATGDDITGLDDEDGVTLPAYLEQSTSATITVNVTNNTGLTAYLNAWIDYNKNGVLTDSGEQIATNTAVNTGTTGGNVAITFTVPAGATVGTTGVRVRLTSTSSPGSTGASGNGEVEDNVITVLPPTDFGDDSGLDLAGSTASTTLRMGALVDTEGPTLGNSAATGDDTNGSDDEDGVTLPASVIQGQSGASVSVTVTNTTGADGYLNGWIDFNNNGLLTDAGDQIVTNDVVATGTSGATRTYTFTVPGSAATGPVGVRFRLSSTATPGATGISGTGEVEDYALNIVPASDHGDFSRFADASSYNSAALGLGDLEDNEITPVTNLAATGDDITNVNDEDGVTLQAILVQGQAGVAVTVKLNNTSGAPAYLNGWVDFNSNGTLDSTEQVITDSVVDDGTSGDFQTFYFDVPSTATIGTAGARFRLTSVASPGPTGASGYGEVEDYTTSIVAPSSNFRDYFYTIRNVSGHFYLDEISVYNPNSASPTVSVTPGILDLNTASPGFSTSSTDAMMNGLALDWLNRRFYWLATSTASGGSGYNANLYTAAYDNVSKTWSYQLVTGSALSNITFNSGTPSSASASSGAFPRAAFYNGEYYAGGQLNNNVAVWHLNATGTGLSTPAYNDYTNFFHLSQTFNGGDFVIRPQDGLLVTSTVINSANTLFNQFLDDGMNASGPAATTANVDAQIPYSSNSSMQIAGVGGVSRLYGLGSTGTNIYRIDRYDTSSPSAVKVGPLPTASYTDLSEGISSSVTSLGVKGIVYYDVNGLTDGIISGTGTNASGTLYAMLVDGSGNLVDSFPVKSDGTFILGGASANTSYRVVLSTSYGSLGSTAPAAAVPNGWLNAGEFLGSGAGSDGTIDGSLAVTVGSVGVVNATFGLSQTLSIGDTVWNDVNNNGLQDVGESGIGSVTVQLWKPGTDNAIGGTGSAADTLAATTSTDATGNYSFVGLTAGKYFVTVTPSTLYSVVSSTVAADNGVDGDNNGSQPGGRATAVYSPIITLTQGAEPGNLSTGGGNIENTIDFGLLTAVDFGDNAAFGSAGSALVSTLYLGSLIDSEYSANNNATATGDDITGVDDEDGVILPTAFYQGASATLTVNVTNTSGSTAFLNAWVDFNGNGVLTDSGEQVASNTIIANGTNGASRNITFTVPSSALPGTVGVRVRLTSISSPGPTGTVGNGEVEDSILTIKGYANLYDPDIGQFGLFVTDGTFSMSNSASGVYGGTGIASGVTLNISDGGLANFVMIHPPQTGTFGNADTLPGTGGSTISPVLTDLSIQRTQAYNLSTNVAAMASTQTFGAMSNSFTITSSGTHNVISMTSLKLSGGSMLTLQGGANDYFFINVASEFTFTGSSGMILSGGVKPQHVIVNLLPGAKALNLTGGSAAYSGTFLAVQSGTATTLTGGSIVTGSVYARDVTLTGGSLINGSAFDNGAPFDLGDYSGFLAAGSVVSSALTIGSVIDSESVLLEDSNATGDDLSGVDDEEGVTVPATMLRGATGTLSINVTNTSGATAYLNAWIDYNRNGVLTDSGEQIATNTAVATGTSGSAQTVTFTVPTTASLGTAGVRVRLTSTSSPGSTGNSGIGEVEDYITTISCLPVTVSPATLPAASVGTALSATISATGGTAPYAYTVSSGTLPAGTTLSSAGVLSGTPSSASASTFTIQATDVNGCAGTQSYTVTPVCPAVTIGQSSLPQGTVGTAYSQTLSATGGTAPYGTWAVTTGTLPAGLSLNASTGVISGTPTASASPATTLTLSVKDTYNCQGTKSVTLQVCPAVTLSPATLPTPSVGTAYSQAMTASGGTAPYTYTVFSGTLPTWATLTSAGVLSGTPNNTIAATFTVKATDANGCATTVSYTVTPVCPTISIGQSALPQGTVGTAYSTTLSAIGGTAPYGTWTLTSGTLPAGLTLNASTGVISGTPTATASPATTLTVRVNDAYGCQGSKSITLQICPVVTLSPATPATGTVGTAYTQTFTASGGTTAYTYTLASGTLPGGLTLNASTGVVSGTPTTQISSNVTLRATDANGCAGTLAVTFAISCPVINLAPATLPVGVVGSAYSQTISASGGSSSYTYALSSGTLPAGLSLNASTGIISGTPTTSNGVGTSITVSATDSFNCSGTKTYALQICPVVTLSPATLPTPTVGTAYSQTLSSSGGASAYTYTVSSGALPGWATLSSSGVLSGTPTSTTAATFTVQSTDANGCAVTRSYTVTPVCPTVTVTPATLPDGIVGTAYSQTISSSGGIAPYTFALTSGTMPAGLTLSASTGVISGTPTTANGLGVNLTIRATDANGCQGSQVVALQICPVINLAPATLPTPTVGTAYSQTLTSSGGTSAYTYTLASGALPTWATLSSGGVLSGTPNSTTAATFTIRSTDANGCTGTISYTLNPVCPSITITQTSLPQGTMGTTYSQTLSASGGISPYSAWTLTSGTLPTGLTLNASTGVISGTPTAQASPATTITVRVNDANGCQGTRSMTLQICPVVTLSPSTFAASTVGTAYTQTVSASGGAAAYLYAITSGSLPGGLSLNTASGVISGTPTTPTAASFTISATDANGCAGSVSYTMTPAPNTDFGDFSGFATASNTSNGTLKIGSLIDMEVTGTSNASATGDDITGSDDEDGVTVPGSITAGATVTIPVVVTNSGSTTAYLNAWIDFNNNGVLTDSGEQIAIDTPVAAGTSAATMNVTFTTPVGASVGASRGVRVRLTGTASPGSTGTGGLGEIEDYIVTIAAPTIDFGDNSAFGSAGSTMNSTLKLGLLTDVEGQPTTNTAATGDDITGSDDEDGVTVPATITQNVASSMTVNVTNTSGASAYLNAWIDYNGNGVLTDSGEQVAINTVIATGTSNSNKTVSFTVPATVKVGTVGVRVRLTSTSSPGSTGTSGNGEVEDYVTSIVATSDFGDYASFGSASSKSNNTLKLGLLVDAEGNSVMDATATGDDLDGSADEDGVTVPINIAQGAASSLTARVTNTSGSAAYLNAWIDFNRNGVLTDSGEQVAVNTSITTGTSNAAQVINFTAPVGASLGTAGVRVRLTSTSSPGPTGMSGNGEVEDYLTTIVVPTTDFGDYSGFADAFSTANSNLVLGDVVDAEGSATRNATATGDDTTGSDDEDSVVFPSMTAGQPGSVSVSVTNTSGAPAYLNAWIDFNNNGVLTDAGEQIASDILIADGTDGGSQVVNFTVPTNAVTAATALGTRLRLTSVASPGPTGGAGIGEVEDHTIVILAPLTDFGDFSGAPDVSNTASTNLRLGALVDTEYSSTRNATATGDDVVGSDDEDGVTLPSLMAGAPATIPVVVTNNSGSVGYLNAWIDYNNNGVFTDSGEQIASNVSIVTGTSNITQNLNITVPAAAQTGTNVGARFRISTDISPGSTGSGGVGEVEDYVVNIAPATTDFGDFASFGSASSIQVSTIKLGPLTDTEYVQTTNATATGDDITGQADEDAVTFPTLTAGAPVTIPVLSTNTSGSAVYLNAWIDYNNNGVLTDVGEQIATNVSIATGTSNAAQNLNITIPATALTGVNLGARFRLTSTSGALSTGAAGNGEVEDYIVNISAPTTDFGDFSGFADASQGANPALHIGALIDAEYASTRNATATGDDITGTDDEDGVAVPSMIAGQRVTIPVTITNTTGAIGYLNAWIDFNNNGVLTDGGEQIATNLNIATGTTNGVTSLAVAVPANAVTGTNVGLRFRLSAPSGLGPTGANGLAGEVEDYVVNIAAPTTDFGDFSGFGSASSTQISTLKIGALTDTEYAQTTNITATGDDITGTDDEDGVTLPSMTAGGPATIPVTVTNSSGATAFLNAWIDYNNNGVLTDAGEQIASNIVIANGTNNVVQNLNITVPATATVGTNLGVRVRLTSTSTPGSTGLSGNGEVEDYLVNIASPTTDFGDFSGFSSASNAAGNGLRLGALIDTEYAGTLNATATGDDITGQADEDGVVLPAMTAGQTLTIPVVVTNTTGSAAFLNAWIDFNNNGVPTDAGEQIITNLSVATGSNGVTINPSITVPADAVTGTALGVRFRLTAVSSPGASGALASLGEVEDYTVTIALPTTDFGDNSALASASSTANTNLRLGLLTDVEYVATTNLTATGDDITGQADEDGVTLPTLTAGAPATIPVVVTNNTGAAAFLNVWIDYNNNAVLTDAGEQIATNVSIPTGTTSGTQNLNITVPATALTGTNLAVRVRLTSVSSPGSTGAAGLGEVEDYLVNIAKPPLDYGDWSGLADAASNASATLRLGALVDTEYVSTRNVGATGDDITGVDDEDGVTLPSLTAGAPATIPVVVTNTSGASAYLNIWIDYNNNGVLTDSGEQIATNVVIANGTNGATQNVNITIPANSVTGSNLGLRVRLTDVASPGVTGTAGTGEVEDYVTPIAVPTTDFGDWNGAADASSIASSNLRMGALADTEYLSTLNPSATGDDITGSDDEDGVTLGSQTPGTAGSATVVVTNNSGAAGYLNAWIDFNNNGSFADAGEQIATNTSIATGTNGATQTVNFIVPVGAVPGQRGARFRLTSTQNPTSVGASGTGEVEDYLVTITCLPIAVTPATLATPTVGTAYSQTVTSTGGLAPYTFSIGSGALPAGLTLSSAGVISGTATSSSSATFSIVATDSYGCSGSTSYTVTPVCPTITVNPTTLPSGLVGTAYSQTLTASGGTAGYTFAVSSGTLPAGLTLNAGTGVISGTPTTSNASGVSLTFRATDANGCSGTRTINLIICPVITLAPATLPTPVVGTSYTQSITASGSTAAYTYTLAGGALPAWATLSSSGVLSGTPTTTTSATFTVKATDANGCTGTLSYTVAPVCPTISITQSALAQGTVGTAYSQTLTASGGTAPYSAWTLTSGTLPAGLTLNASTGVISGTPTAVVSPATTITVRVNDANGCQGSRSITVQICPVITLTPSTLPAPVVGTAYSQSLAAANGTSPYTFTLASGALPAWATLSSAGVLSGTPTTTTAASFTVKATDANGCAGTLSYTLTPVCPTISLAPSVPAQSMVGSLYSQTLTPSGGTAPYSAFTVTSGTLPAGLSLNANTGVISGTPTATNGAGVSVSIRVTDTYGCQGTQAITLQVCPVITLAPVTPATPTVSTAYSQTFIASGSTGSYTFTLAGGALPTWATLSSSGTLSGMPDSPNSATFTLKATDANGCSGTQSYTITPVCPAMTITPLTVASGTVGSTYSQTLSGNGGTAPYGAWTVTSGTLPAGLSLSLSGVISGTPTASNGAGVSFTVRTTDARGCSISAVISLKICPVVSVSPSTLAASTAGSSYSQTISASGGATPYVYAVASGTLPAGLTLNSSSGVISGTPTSTAVTNFTISATDANGCAGTRSYSLTPACQTITVGPATLSNGTVNSAYSQTVNSTSGIGTVTFAISSGSLPAGLSLNGSTGVISGTPTSTLAATFTVRATDSNGCTGSTSYTVTPACPTITVTPTTLITGGVGVVYSQTLSGVGGIAPYTSWTVTSGTLPAGLTLNPSSGVISGTPTTANGAGVNVTVRTTDANGCTGSSSLSIKICPVITQSPATLTAPTVGTAYTQVITAAGGVSPYTFTVASGSLPAGMTLSSSGTISGTTPSSATASFSIKVTAADGCSGTANYTLTPVCPTLAISPNGTLPPAYLGAAYTQAITASGGTSAYTFALLSGDLPSGVLLASNGVLNGTPTAKGVFPVTIRVTDANSCAQSFNVTLQVHTLTIGNLVFEDSNNNGLKDTSEPGVAGATVQLFTPGSDNAIGGSGTAADTQVGGSLTTDSTGAYLFNFLPAGKYYIKVTPPADYLFTGGTADTSDDDIDNNNDGAQPGGSGTPLYSPVVTLSGGAESTADGDSDPDTNLTVDFGLWSSVGVGNMIFLDINGDGHRNEGESLGSIYVELYAQGATPGVDDPVSAGTSGCSCKGRYFLDSLNPGTYFLYIPPSQFATGAPLEGLLPISNVVAGDDDVGQDLIYNSNPAVNGASTSLFTLRPGFCPTGSAESGAEGSIDDSMDARVDLTRDLGVVAPAGTGFAASEAIRRYIVTGGFTASVLPGATTFALWSQNSNIGKATDDPDEDGLANLMEYALGTDPGNPLQTSRFTLTHDAATGSLTALLTLPTGTHDDLSISLETLTDLSKAGTASAWKKLSMAATTTLNADGTLTRAYANLEKLLVFSGLDTGFIRLHVDLDANRDGVPEATVTSAIQGWSRQSFATGSRTFSMPLLNAAFFTGRAVSASGNEIMLPAILTLPAGSLYLEALDGTLAGQRFDIDSTASSGNTVVLQNTSQSYAGLANARITIRLHHTLAGLLPAAAFSSDDRVLFFDTAASNFTTLTQDGETWLNGVLSMNARPVAAHEAAMVQIRGSGTVIMFTGEVRQSTYATPLVAGTQLVAPGWPVISPAPVTGLSSGLTAESADRFRLWDGDTTTGASSYTGYYLDGSTTPPAWLPQTTPAPAASVLPFHGYFLIRTAPLQLQQNAPW